MDAQTQKLIVKKYFEENNFVQSNIQSFNSFVEWRLQKLVDEIGAATPAVIPPETEEVKFTFGKIRIEQPCITEADGSKRKILPMEARIRNLNYFAPVFVEMSLFIDGKERERQEVPVAELPVMLKSCLCYLKDVPQEELISAGEDVLDPGGYFIVNGTERTLSMVEDLAPNTIYAAKEKTGPVTHIASVYSASDAMKIPHTLERTKEGIMQLTFSSNQKIPLVLLMKALGLARDADIINAINFPEAEEDLYINLFDFLNSTTENSAKNQIAELVGASLIEEQKLQRIDYILDNILLPHVGNKPQDRLAKAFYLGRLARKLLLLKAGKIRKDDRDHYANKRVRLAGDLLDDLFRANLKILVSDILYIFQRGVRRGKILPISAIVRTKFITDRICSAMATGNWATGRQGLSQRLERDNALATLSHLLRVTSLLEAQRESFEARQLHPTHWGRVCPIESPDGKHIGLRKNLSLLASVTPAIKEDDTKAVLNSLEQFGLQKLKVQE